MLLSDLFMHDVYIDGIKTKAIIIIIFKTKCNQFEQVQHSSIIRNVDPSICLVSVLSMFLFYRFTCVGKQFPDLSNPSKCYNDFLFCGKKEGNPLSDSAHSTAIRKMLEDLKLNLTKLTHLGNFSLYRKKINFYNARSTWLC